MERATVRLASTADTATIDRLRDRLASDGEPAIRVAVEGRELVLSADTARVMLRARVLAAIEDVGGGERFRLANRAR